jgi:hypothetical protein
MKFIQKFATTTISVMENLFSQFNLFPRVIASTYPSGFADNRESKLQNPPMSDIFSGIFHMAVQKSKVYILIQTLY